MSHAPKKHNTTQNTTESQKNTTMDSNQNDTVAPTFSDSLEDLDSLEDDAATTTTTTTTAAVPITAVPPPPQPPHSDDSRRLFQRLWTDEDEIELLQGFLDYTTLRTNQGAAHPHHDTAAFYDIVKPKLQFEFNKSQLVEKLRRLKKKFRNLVGRVGGRDFAFKCAHDEVTFELSKKIWGGIVGVKCEDNLDEEFGSPNGGGFCEEKSGKSKKRVRSGGSCDGDVGKVVEESVKRCVSPMVKELVNGVINGVGTSPGFSGIGMVPLGFGREVVGDERWRKQQILELEVYSKRLELVQEQVKAALEELRSSEKRGFDF